ncbi:MAG: NAD-binding protein [Nocardioidaceae bacterium]|nr:NAD-binding protein [Nocardioidaceae bacterium]
MTYLVVGETAVATRVCATLGEDVVHLVAPTDDQLADAMAGGLTRAAVLIRDDVSALRYALAVAHLDERLPMVVSIFDRTIAEQLRALLPQARVVSPAALAAPSLAAACLAATPPPRRVIPGWLVRAWPDLRHQQPGSRLLALGLAGLVTVLLLDLTWLLLDGRGLAEAYVEAARVVATVGPAADHAGTAYSIFAGSAMLLTILFAALFTAGVVERLVSPPLAGILGRRSVPHRDHVIVVGLGQVGLRLCALLRERGVPVVGVERDRDAPMIRLARTLGIPVVIGQGTDRRVLEDLGLRRCRAVAAVGSDDLDNIAVAVAASAVAAQVPVVLRAGEHEAIRETRSLLPLGTTRDVTAIAAEHVVAQMQGEAAPERLTGTERCRCVLLESGS